MIIPVQRGQEDSEWLKEAIAGFPNTPYIVAVNDGEVAEAVNEAVRNVSTKWVFIHHFDDRAEPNLLDALLTYGWDCDVVYPSAWLASEDLSQCFVDQWAQPFCPNRLLLQPYIPPHALILRERFLEVGGYDAAEAPLEHWGLYLRGAKAGWRFKPCMEAYFVKRLCDGSRSQLDTVQEAYDRITEGREEFKATFYFQATHATSYLRCLLPAKYLPAVARNELNSLAVPQEDGEVEVVFPTHEGKAAVLQFAGDGTWALLSHALQEDGVRVLVEVDDNYLVDPGKHIRKLSSWGANIGDAIHTFQGHTYIAKWASGIIVTTEHLARAYRKVNKNVYVIPNPVDPADWYYPRPDDGIFRIGWFASKSHAGDEQLIARGLEWASRQKDVEVWTLGYDPGWKFAYQHSPWVNDLSVWRAMNSRLDVGLAPVVAGHWSAYRSDIKASEYTMGGAAVIASDVPPYAEWTDDFSIKAKTAKDFYHGIKRLVENRDEARQMQAAAREWVDRNRDIRVLVERWREALEI